MRRPGQREKRILEYREKAEKTQRTDHGDQGRHLPDTGPGGDDGSLGESPPKRHYRMNGLHICVDSYKDGDIAGRAYSKLSRDALNFGNVGELLLRADALFDERGYPQNFQEKRSFAENPMWDGRYEPPKTFRKDEDIFNQSGAVCTIDITVITRRRASWQGILMNGEKPARNFESAKELMELLLAEVRQRWDETAKSE